MVDGQHGITDHNSHTLSVFNEQGRKIHVALVT